MAHRWRKISSMLQFELAIYSTLFKRGNLCRVKLCLTFLRCMTTLLVDSPKWYSQTARRRSRAEEKLADSSREDDENSMQLAMHKEADRCHAVTNAESSHWRTCYSAEFRKSSPPVFLHLLCSSSQGQYLGCSRST